MKKILLSLLIFISVNVYAQQKGISYQAVILNPKGTAAPGVDISNTPLANKNICMLFEVLDGASSVEYQESVQTTTDQYGMVNLTIGTGTRTGGTASSFSKINWTTGGKKLVVKINTTGTCSSYTEISNQPLMFVPYALFADNANVAEGAITAAKLADGAITDAKIGTGISASKVGLGNVNNTSDANKPVSIAAQAALDNKENSANKATAVALGTSDVLFPTQNAVKTYVDGKVSGATIVDANATTKGKIQLAGDLAGTAAAPTVPGLGIVSRAIEAEEARAKLVESNNSSAIAVEIERAKAAEELKENTTNKSQVIVTGLSNDKYPSVNAVKTYVDGAVVSGAPDADATTKGKIQLAGDLAGTAAAPTVPGLVVQAAAIALNTAKVGFTDSLVAISPSVVANTAKVGITTQQANDIIANNAKVGFTDSLAAISPAVVANTAKVGITTQQASDIIANNAKVGITTQQANDIITNTAKVGFTDALVAASPAVVANTAKVGITTQQASDITVNNAKVGITTQQASDIIGNNAKVGITTQQANDIITNNAKVGFTDALVAASPAVVAKQDIAKLSTDVQTDIAADDKYPSVKAIVTYVNALQAAGGVPPANTTALGTIKIAGDLGGTANSPTVPALATKVDKVTGERLINAAEITKLTAITGSNTGDQDLSSFATTTALANKVDKVTGERLINAAEITKLTAITGSNTGDQDLSSFATTSALATKVDKVTGERLINAAEITKLTAITGSNTGDQDLSSFATTTALALKAPIASPTFTGTVAGIDKTMVGLGNVENTSDANKIVSIATQAAIDGKENITNKSADGSLGSDSDVLYPTEKAVKTYVDGGDLTLNNKITALKSSVTANETAANSAIVLKEDAANKSTDGTLATNSTTFFPTVRAVKTYVDAAKLALQNNIDAVQTEVTSNKTTVNNAISSKEDAANKSNDATLAGNSTTLFPTQQAVKTYIDTKSATVNATNANLTGPITSSGNATAVASQTGTGSTFVMNTSPTLVTPNLGTPTALVGTNITLLPLASAVTGNLSVANGGTGVNTLTGYVKGNGTSAFTSSSTIPVADVAGAVKTVNGNSPVNGNVSISFGSVVTGSLASRTVNPGTNGNIFVVSGDSNTADNGRTFISDGANWQEVTANQAATDNRYVQLAGSTMLGNLAFPTGKKATMADAPSGSTDLVNKNYVDTQISNASPVASTTVKGIVKLAGDLAGSGSTADAPVISANAITTAKIADASVTSAKLDATGVAANTYGSTTAIPVITVDAKGRITAINTTSISATLTEVVEEFLAPNAAQTSFTFTQTPATTTKVRMYINGVLIKGSAISVAAKVLTYNPVKNGNYAISVGDEVVFYYYY